MDVLLPGGAGKTLPVAVPDGMEDAVHVRLVRVAAE